MKPAAAPPGRHGSRKPPRASRLALGAGAAWGAALGVWLLAPRLLVAEHVSPHGAAQWVAVESAALAAFAVVGALVSFFACFALVARQAVVRRPFEEPGWAYGLAAPPLLVAGYLGAAAILERVVFGAVPSAARLTAAGVPAAAAGAAAAAAGLAAYRAVLARARRPSAATAAGALVAAALLGAAVLPLRVPTARSNAGGSATVLVRRGGVAPPPLLFVGIDSGNWRTLAPLSDAGAAPALSRIAREGIHGTLRALWPPYWSAPAWGAIVTGRPREEIDVWSDLLFEVPGLPPLTAPLEVDPLLDPVFALEYALAAAGAAALTPPPRSALRAAPFWESVARAGTKAAVVRFWFTYPARDQASIVISDRAGSDEWSLMGVRKEEREPVASPAARAPELLAPFSGGPSPTDPFAALGLARPERRPLDAVVDPFEVLRSALEIDDRTLAASEALVREDPRLPLLAVYLGGFDSVCHAYWQYRFPDEFLADRPDEASVRELGPVIDRYLERLDRGIGRLVAAYAAPPNVVVVSDHGHQATHTHEIWKGWHGPEAIFLAAGPGVERRSEMLEMSYYDVVPMVFELLGFERPVGPSALPRTGGAGRG